MGLRVNNNIAALNSYNSLQKSDKAMGASLSKLSSGYRINKAADDAAGLVVSEGLRSQIGGLTQASRNAQDGVNVAQTVDGALGTQTSILQRMRDLAVQASNSGSQDATATAAANSEFQQLSNELTRISSTTSFGSQQLLSGNYNGTFQIGANATTNDKLNVDLTANIFGTPVPSTSGSAQTFVATSTSATGYAYNSGDRISISDGTNSVVLTLTATTASATDLKNALTTAASAAGVSGKFNFGTTTAGALTVTSGTVGARGNTTINTVTAAGATGTIAGGKSVATTATAIGASYGTAASFSVQVGTANAITVNLTRTTGTAADTLNDINSALSGSGATASLSGGTTGTLIITSNSPLVVTDGTATPLGAIVTSGAAGVDPVLASPSGFSATGLRLDTVSLTADPNAAIKAVDNALKGVNSARATVGAVQNRFENAISNLAVSIENVTASESAIRDTDMAAEMTKFTKNQILTQAGTSMLAQANSSTQNILTLLRG
ncbi:flagellin [Kineococcus sp. GCM10028916]|uniref:flagellin N-terminal helical domain-containing protein n=1 Tax=Kineococcus sp. GCM10028916 TaxID=3273394 RepID=UPI003641C5EF